MNGYPIGSASVCSDAVWLRCDLQRMEGGKLLRAEPPKSEEALGQASCYHPLSSFFLSQRLSIRCSPFLAYHHWDGFYSCSTKGFCPLAGTAHVLSVYL